MYACSVPLAAGSRFVIWSAAVSFVLFQFFLQLSSGVVIGSIMEEMQLSALTAGFLGSSLYIIYTAMQMPVGILFDRQNARLLIVGSALVCSVGCLAFAASETLVELFITRFLMGAGASFAFVGLSSVLRQHFPLKQFAFMIGVSETLAFFVTVFTMIGMGGFLAQWGWRGFIGGAGCVGILIALFCWHYIPSLSPEKSESPNDYRRQITAILKSRVAWFNGLFVGLFFTVITVFGALWAVPFIQVKLACSLFEATFLGAMLFLGAGVSCPLFGQLASWCKSRTRLILCSSVSTTSLLLALLYVPTANHWVVGMLMFGIGACCGAYMLAYSIANELAPAGSLSTCTGFTNTLAVVTAPLLQPLIGYLLDMFNPLGEYTVADYQKALLVIPISVILAGIMTLFLPEKARD